MWTCPKCGRSFKRTNQDHYCGKAPASMDEYIHQQDIAVQPALISLRNAIHDAIPEAEERIAWSMPTWKKNGHIISFAVSKNHIGVYIGEEAVSYFHDRLQGIDIYKGNLRLKRNQEMPLLLISDIAKWRFAMDQKRTDIKNSPTPENPA